MTPRRRRRAGRLWAAVAAVAALALGVAALRFRRTLRRAEDRLLGQSAAIPTRFGLLEYADVGRGPPLLMLHGTGGGFDQGLSFAQGVLARGCRVIAPSRFGYLGSDFPADPTSENQADALVHLLDALGIGRIAVAGGSAGALAAMQLALRHPDRCAALILLVPAGNLDGRDPAAMTRLGAWLVRRLLRSDALFWLALRLVPRLLIGTLLATDPALLAGVTAVERHRAFRILEELMPIRRRWRGMLNDASLAGSPFRGDVGAIAVPTLVLSVEDDRFGTAATARLIAARVAGARLVVYPSGGHIWLGRDAAVADEIARFVAAHAA
jgi:2-hydroxy-6-oxonona-2,4-dienedioate hydrolase